MPLWQTCSTKKFGSVYSSQVRFWHYCPLAFHVCMLAAFPATVQVTLLWFARLGTLTHTNIQCVRAATAIELLVWTDQIVRLSSSCLSSRPFLSVPHIIPPFFLLLLYPALYLLLAEAFRHFFLDFGGCNTLISFSTCYGWIMYVAEMFGGVSFFSFRYFAKKVSRGRCVGNGYDAYDDGRMDHELRSDGSFSLFPLFT